MWVESYSVTFRTYRELEEKLLKQQNLVLTLYMWRKEESREFIGDTFSILFKILNLIRRTRIIVMTHSLIKRV
jgi:hypothetical protein